MRAPWCRTLLLAGISGLALLGAAAFGADKSEPFPFLPASARGLSSARPDQASLLRWAREVIKSSAAPLPCFEQLAGSIDATYQVVFGPQQTVNVWLGKLDRDATESCAGAFMAALGKKLSFAREGNLTVVTSGANRSHVGWREDGYVVWGDDRALVESFLKKPVGLAGNPALAKLLPRVDRSQALWMVCDLDLTTPTLGVPSRGMIWAFTLDPTRKQFPVSFVFESAAKAKEAERAVAGRTKDESVPAAVRDALQAVSALAQSDQLSIDLLPFLSRPMAVIALEGMINSTNVEQLRAIQAETEQRFAQLKERADGLGAVARETDRLEAELRESLAAVKDPRDRAAIEALKAEPEAQAANKVTPLPPVDPKEGAQASRLRAQIAETRSRTTQLEGVLVGLAYHDALQRELEAKLAAIKKLREKKAK